MNSGRQHNELNARIARRMGPVSVFQDHDLAWIPTDADPRADCPRGTIVRFLYDQLFSIVEDDPVNHLTRNERSDANCAGQRCSGFIGMPRFL